MKFRYQDIVKIKHPFYKELYGRVSNYKKPLFGEIRYFTFVYRDKELKDYMSEYREFKESDLEKLND